MTRNAREKMGRRLRVWALRLGLRPRSGPSTRRPSRMAARLGLEPRQAESESAVLPLHHQAVEKILRGLVCGRPGFALLRRGIPSHCEGMEPATGFEPATACLQNRCSAVELRRPSSPHTGGVGLIQRTGGSPGTRTPNLLIKSQLLYH